MGGGGPNGPLRLFVEALGSSNRAVEVGDWKRNKRWVVLENVFFHIVIEVAKDTPFFLLLFPLPNMDILLPIHCSVTQHWKHPRSSQLRLPPRRQQRHVLVGQTQVSPYVVEPTYPSQLSTKQTKPRSHPRFFSPSPVPVPVPSSVRGGGKSRHE